mmetsp:Transcript_9261/g.10573  ORF Transcript_9261/g.10573 Transcript_9261/m.10573 type:complete len:96 (-) Transcript_9261:117-404(-)
MSSATQPLQLDGCCNRSPSIGGDVHTDYVILGSHDTWISSPKSLTINSIGTKDVAKEEYDYMSRGWKLTDGEHNGSVALQDGSKTPVKINVITVC